MVGSSFAGINSDKAIDLTSLSVKGYDVEDGDDGTVFVQFLTAAGRADGSSYTWMDLPGEFDPGWYDDDYEPISKGDVTIKAGDGLWTNGDPDFTIDFAGEVIQDGAALPLRTGFKALCNPVPTAVDLTDCWVTGYDAEDGDDGTVFVQFLTAAGRADGSSYTWMDLPGEFDPGWYDDDYEPISKGDVVLNPGDGMWVSGNVGFTLNFPALKK